MLFLLALLISLPADAALRCEMVLLDVPTTLEDLARFQVEIESKPPRERAIYLEDIRTKYRELNPSNDPALRSMYTTRLEELRKAPRTEELRTDKIEKKREEFDTLRHWRTAEILPGLYQYARVFLNNTQLLMPTANKTLGIYDLDKKQVVRELPVNIEHVVANEMLVSHDKTKIYIYRSHRKVVEVVEIATGKVEVFQDSNAHFASARIKMYETRSGSHLILTDWLYGDTAVFRTSTKELLTLPIAEKSNYVQRAAAPAESVNGRWAFFPRENGAHFLLDLLTDSMVTMPEVPGIATHRITDAFFSADGRVLTLLRRGTDPLDYHLDTHTFSKSRFEISSREHAFVSSDFQRVSFYNIYGTSPTYAFDMTSGQKLTPVFDGVRSTTFEFSELKNDDILVFLADHQRRRYPHLQSPGPRLLRADPGQNEIVEIDLPPTLAVAKPTALSPDGKRLVLWDPATNKMWLLK